MLNTIKISAVYDRKHVATKATAKHPIKGLVQFTVTVNGERKYLSTGIRVYLGQFAGEQVTARNDAEELNTQLSNHRRAIIDLVNRCNSEGKVFAWPMLDGLRIRRGKGDTSWTDWMERAINSRRLAPGTRIHQMTVLQFLRREGVTDFAQLTTETVTRIDDILHARQVNGRPMLQTSIYGYHKVIKAYIHLAMREGLIEYDPYTRFRTSKGESRPREVLTMEEIRRLEQLTTRSLYMQHVRDLFLLQVWTGLGYSDLMSADFTRISGDTLSGRRCKTGTDYTTVILPQAKTILERYGYRVPVMAYDDYRRMLQPLCDLAGIDKHISTHNGRHTFATIVTLGHGVPIEMVSKMLGHKSIKTTQIYARVQRPMIQEQAERLSKLAL